MSNSRLGASSSSSSSRGGTGGGGKGLIGGVLREEENEGNWEVRPGGMLVQRRRDVGGNNSDENRMMSGGGGSGSGGGGEDGRTMVRIKVSHGSYQFDVSLPAQATFGDLKDIVSKETGLEPQDQRLLFRGKEKDDDEFLHIAGIKDRSKVILMEDPARKERKLEQAKKSQEIAKACEAIGKVRDEVDGLSEKLSAIEGTVLGGKKVNEKEFDVLTELFMTKLLKLDSIEASGEAKAQRKVEVRRIQNFVETLDSLKARNGKPAGSTSSGISMAKW